MSRFLLLALVSVPLLAGTVPHTSAQKPAWKWTDEERIAVRSNPVAAAARVAAHEARQSKPSKMATSSVRHSNVADVIDGTTNPELLMPSEVFNSFLKKVYLADANYETRFAATRMAIGLPSDFTDRLSVLAGPYLKELREQRARGLRAAKATPDERAIIQNDETASSSARCGLLSDALVAAHREFGAEKFDEYIYTVAAPSMVILSDRVDDSASLRRAAGGCR